MSIAAFINTHLPLTTPPGFADPKFGIIRLHLAGPASGLRKLTNRPPYWAYIWAGGAVLAMYLHENAALIRGKRVLDLGAGSGLVGIMAARFGAGPVLAADCDPIARAAIALNAAANSVSIIVLDGNPLQRALPDVDVVLAGDVFYDPSRAGRMLAYLDRCAAAGMLVLIGDPGRAALPRHRLRVLATYAVRDMGETPGGQTQGQVFGLDPNPVPPKPGDTDARSRDPKPAAPRSAPETTATTPSALPAQSRPPRPA